MVTQLIKQIIIEVDPEAEKRFNELDSLKKKFNKLTNNGKKRVARDSKANLLAINYNKRKFWFQPALPVVQKEKVA